MVCFFFFTVLSRDFRGLVISHYWSEEWLLLLWIPYTSGALYRLTMEPKKKKVSIFRQITSEVEVCNEWDESVLTLQVVTVFAKYRRCLRHTVAAGCGAREFVLSLNNDVSVWSHWDLFIRVLYDFLDTVRHLCICIYTYVCTYINTIFRWLVH